MAQTETTTFGVSRRLWDALAVLVADDADGARLENGIGANKADSAIFRSIYAAGFAALTRGQAVWLHKALRKYSQTQLEPAGIHYADIPDPSTAAATVRRAAAATITLDDGALIFRGPRDHPATDLVRALAHRRWTGADGSPQFCWRIALDVRNLDGLRQIYRSRTVAFDDASIAALKELGQAHRGQKAQGGSKGQPAPTAAPAPPGTRTDAGQERVAVTPEVCANLRQLEPTLHPSTGDNGVAAPPIPAPLSDGFVRVAYTIAPGSDNTMQYRLMRTPQGVTRLHEGTYLTGDGAGPFASPQAAQDAADAFNSQTRQET